jgi:hypothetical protein
MASALHDPKARATLLHMAQVWLRLAGQGDLPNAEEKMRSGRGVSAFPVGLLGEPLPGLRHLLHDFAMSLGPGLASQALAFLRKSPVFRCCFHAGITGRSTGPFRMHGGHASGTRSLIDKCCRPRVWPADFKGKQRCVGLHLWGMSRLKPKGKAANGGGLSCSRLPVVADAIDKLARF